MSESNWMMRLVRALDAEHTATESRMLDDRFAAQEQAVRDIETRLAALEDAVSQVASGCKWPECEAPTVAPEPFTCGPGHAALRDFRDHEAARRSAGLPVAAKVEEDGDAPKRGRVTREEWELLRAPHTGYGRKGYIDLLCRALPGVECFRLRLRSNGNLEYCTSPIGTGSVQISGGYQSRPPAELIDALITDGVCQMPEIVEPDTPPTCEPGACELALLTRQLDALASAASGALSVDDIRDVLGVDCDDEADPLDAIVELREERTRLREERDELHAAVERVREYAAVVQVDSLGLPFGMCAAVAAVLALLDNADTPKQEG